MVARRFTLGLTALVLVSASLIVWRFTKPRPPFDMDLVCRMPIRASQAYVEKILGRPQYIHDANRGWDYYRDVKSPVVHVWFDANMLFESFALDDDD